MLTSNRLVLVLALAVSGAALAVSGCGNDVPPNAVAKVGDTVVTRSDFNKWLGTAARGQSQGSAVVVPDPPDFKNCVAQREKQKTPKGATKPSPSELKRQCQQEFNQLKGKVTNADVRTYYAKNKKRFAQPERRDLRVVLTKTKAKAMQADKALKSNQSWAVVAKKYSIDPASRSHAGRLPDVARGQQEKALDTAVFSARKGKLEGPVKTQFGWYVFEVTKVTPASQQSLAQAQDTIRNLLRSQRQQKALDDFVKSFRDKYRGKTTCADGYKVSECKNGPKEKTQTGPTPGGAQPSPQAPSGGGTQGPSSP